MAGTPRVQLSLKGRLLSEVAFVGTQLRIGRMRENDVVVNNLAVRLGADLAAGAPFYGAPPSDENAAKIKAAMMLHYEDPTKDTGIGARIPAYEAALKANNKQYQLFIYECAQHGFHNDTTPRYDEAAAKLAWQRSLEFFNKNLRG